MTLSCKASIPKSSFRNSLINENLAMILLQLPLHHFRASAHRHTCCTLLKGKTIITVANRTLRHSKVTIKYSMEMLASVAPAAWLDHCETVCPSVAAPLTRERICSPQISRLLGKTRSCRFDLQPQLTQIKAGDKDPCQKRPDQVPLIDEL